MLDANVRTQLTGYLTKLQRPIELVASLDASEASGTMRALLEDIAACSSKVSVRFDGDASRRPSFSVAAHGEAARIRFAGLPLGHEFTSLVLALLHSGGHPPKADAATIEQIRAIALPAQFEVFVSLSCHNCPDVVQALNLIAALNPAVQTTMIDGALFQDEVTARDILAVPIVYRNGEVFGHGRMTLEEIVAKLDDGSNAARRAQALDARAPYDVLVVGGGPAGAAAAIYAARKGIRIGVVAERFGGQVLDTLGIENFVSIQQTEGPKLVADLEAHVQQHEVDLISQERVQALIPGEQGHALQLASGARLRAKSVVLATGARWRELGVPGEAEYKTKGVCFCPHCDGPLFKGKRVAVIGGGNSGVEAAIDLAGLVAHVTLIEYDTALRADAVLQNKLRSLTNVDVVLNARTTEVVGDGRKVVGMRYVDRASDEVHTCDVEGVFVQIGLLPNTDWLRGTVALSPRGEIEVDARGETSVPGVFAAGDCTTTPFKQIVIALGEGAKASLSAFDHLMRLPVEPRAVEAA